MFLFTPAIFNSTNLDFVYMFFHLYFLADCLSAFRIFFGQGCVYLSVVGLVVTSWNPFLAAGSFLLI